MAQAKQARKGLGRGLSALIPTDMDFLAEVARGDFSVLAPDTPVSRETEPSPSAQDSTDLARQSQVLAGAENAAVLATLPAKSLPEEEAREPEPGQGAEAEGQGEARDGVVWAAPSEIVANPYQPRRTFDEAELADLSDSIREHGVLQPILVRPAASGAAGKEPSVGSPGVGLPSVRYQIIAGERRWRASQRAEMERVPIIVREVSDQQALELAIIENVQRHDISAMDAAVAYERLAREFGLSQESIARRVGKSRPAIVNTMRLLGLPPEAQRGIQEGAISEGHGRAILMAPSGGARRALLRAITRDRLSVRQAEEVARGAKRRAQADAHTDARASTQDGASSSHDPETATPGATSDATSAARTGDALPAGKPALDDTSDAADLGAAAEYTLHAREDTALEEKLQRALSCRVQIKRRRAGGQIVLFASDDDQIERLIEGLCGQ